MRIPYEPSNWYMSKSTQTSIIRTFVEKAFPDFPKVNLSYRSAYLSLSYSFHFYNGTIDIGHLMGELKVYEKEIVNAAKPYYDDWELKTHTNKYNL